MPYNAIRRLIINRGAVMVDPPLLQPADLFLDLAGEDLRRRLFLTQGPNGVELCLRPDFTIPVCRIHLDGATPERIAEYGYLGPIFRHHASATGETLQAGFESFGRADREAADADVLAFALEACRVLGLADPVIRMGDTALFIAALDALSLPDAWRDRLHRMFGDRKRLNRCLKRIATGENGESGLVGHAGFLAALEGADPEAARSVVEDLMAIAGVSPVGGRSAAEIADRFLEQAALSAGSGVGQDRIDFLEKFLDVSGQAEAVLEQLAALARDYGVDIDDALDDFARRLDACAAHGISGDGVEFIADFGRRLDYYSGFVFEAFDPDDPQGGQLVRGGRYDGLVEHMEEGRVIPAVGCALWLDRFATRGG